MVVLAGIRRRFVVITIGPGLRRGRYHALFAEALTRRSAPLAFRRPAVRVPLPQLMRTATHL
jgi:hypothetical protein